MVNNVPLFLEWKLCLSLTIDKDYELYNGLVLSCQASFFPQKQIAKKI